MNFYKNTSSIISGIYLLFLFLNVSVKFGGTSHVPISLKISSTETEIQQETDVITSNHDPICLEENER